MAVNEIHIAAAPDRVFALLSDPRAYAAWVVGTRAICSADAGWPTPGTAFEHRVGIGPMTVADRTSVLTVQEPELLELLARASPLPPARVRLQLIPQGDGTRLRMEEEPASRLLSILLGPVGHRLLWLRNVRSLRRLRDLAEGRLPPPDGELPPRPERR